MNLESLFTDNPYSLVAADKRRLLGELLWELTFRHRAQCEQYRRILEALPITLDPSGAIETIPMLPVRLFKMHDLRSVPPETIIKTLTSSGTTSQVVSRIYLDRETSLNQTKALSSIIRSFVGGKRLPMILVDAPNVINDRSSFSARGAGLLGLTFFGRDHFYLLDESMEPRWAELDSFIERHQGEKILVFGFTFMVWRYFYQPCLERNRFPGLDNSILIHSGGWKKLQEEAVDNRTFKAKLREQMGIPEVYNFYGMVEQVGSIFMECPKGHLHAPDFADIIVRDPDTLVPMLPGRTGLVQVLSLLPGSYPGHSLLTEDLGTLLGEDDCPCDRKGKYFSIQGRLPAAELRGCSDTHAYGREAI